MTTQKISAESSRPGEIVHPKPLQSLLGSAQRLTGKSLSENRTHYSQSTSRSWQEDAWDMYDLVGEERFLATTLAGRLSQAKLFVGVIDEMGEDPTPVENKEIADILKAFGKTAAGRAQLLYRLSINLFVAGEGWLAGLPDDDKIGLPLDPFDLDWKMLSVSEVSVNASGKVALKLSDKNGDVKEYDPDDIFLIRVWRSHPRRWWEADSPTRASLAVLRELVGLTMHISAQVDSRLAGAGLLVVPQSAQRALQAAAGLDESTAEDQFTEALMEAMLTPIGDRASASAIVPLVITVPDDSVDKFNFITFAKPLDAESRNLRDEAIRRLALGQDAPPELLLGTSCVDTETEILTQRGWQTLVTLDPFDLVLTLNPITGLSEWQPMQAINRYEVVDEPMLRMVGKGVNSLTTMNHRWLTTSANHNRTEFVTSRDLNSGHLIPTAAPCAELPVEVKYSDDFVELAAWFWTEGSFSPGVGRWGQACIAQSESKNPERVARIRQALIRTFGEWGWETRQNGQWGSDVVRFNLRKHVGEALLAIGGKHVSLDFVRSLTRAQLELFIDVSCQGDGWHYYNGRLDIWQKDPSALDAYELACVLSGRTVSRTVYNGGEVVNPYRKSTIRPVKAKITSEETYTGTIWCPTTQNGTWFMRRGGVSCWTGNSMNHWGGWLVQEEVVSSHIEPPLALMCDALTTDFLWPVLESMGVPPEKFETYVIWYDVSHLIVQPNHSADAIVLHGRGVITDEAVRTEAGFEESDAPAVTDPAIKMALTMVQANSELLTAPGLQAVVDQLRAVMTSVPPAEVSPVGVPGTTTTTTTVPAVADLPVPVAGVTPEPAGPSKIPVKGPTAVVGGGQGSGRYPKGSGGTTTLSPSIQNALSRGGEFQEVAAAEFQAAFDQETLADGATFHVMGMRDGTMSVQVLSKDGKQIGRAGRDFYTDADGNLTVEHRSMHILSAYQGKGYGSALNRAAETVYRRNGVKSITLQANVDVGGYAWAKAGFDWAPGQGSWSRVKEAAQNVRRETTGKGDPLFEQVTTRMMAADPLNRETWPLPHDLAMVGWSEGATEWPGRTGMLHSSWEGIKTL